MQCERYRTSLLSILHFKCLYDECLDSPSLLTWLVWILVLARFEELPFVKTVSKDFCHIWSTSSQLHPSDCHIIIQMTSQDESFSHAGVGLPGRWNATCSCCHLLSRVESIPVIPVTSSWLCSFCSSPWRWTEMTEQPPEFAVDTLCLLDKVSNNVRLELHQIDLVTHHCLLCTLQWTWSG